MAAHAEPDAAAALTASRSSARSTTAAWRRPRPSPPPTGSTASRSTRPGAWLGIVAAGKTYYDVRQALRRARPRRRRARGATGIRLLKIGMLYPLEPRHRPRLRARASRRSWSSRRSARSSSCSCATRSTTLAERPRMVGKRDEQGRPLVPADGELDADRVARSWPAASSASCSSPRSPARVAAARGAARAPGRADAGAPGVLLLGLPAQPLHRGAGGLDGRRPASAATAWR